MVGVRRMKSDAQDRRSSESYLMVGSLGVYPDFHLQAMVEQTGQGKFPQRPSALR
jgi:hypothetical protein